MNRFDGYIFVLWGAQFDEAPAAIFVTAFRDAGWRVKVVGLHGQRITGAYGMTLAPDIYLDEALPLASKTACLILPATLRMLNSFSYDPRLIRFLAAVRSSGAKIVVGGLDPDPNDANPLLQPDEVEVYAGGEGIFEYARWLGKSL